MEGHTRKRHQDITQIKKKIFSRSMHLIGLSFYKDCNSRDVTLHASITWNNFRFKLLML